MEEIRRKNIRFRKNIQIGEDLQFNLDYLECVPGNYGMLNEPLYHYVRCNKQSLSLVYYENAIEHTKQIYQELLRFAQKLEDITNDDIMVLKSIYLTDWTARITALYADKDGNIPQSRRYQIAQYEVKSEEFQSLLQEVRQHRKITYLRYRTLKMKRFDLYFFFRGVYRLIK